jgi:ATP-dependent protease ClpP protease subunit
VPKKRSWKQNYLEEIQEMNSNIKQHKLNVKMAAKFWQLKKDESKNEAELVLYGDISNTSWYGDEITPKKFDDDIKKLGDVKNINVRINSYGGDVFAGLAIYSTLKRHPSNIIVHIDGIAASAASLICMAGNKILMPANAMMMIHNPWTVAIGDSEKMRKTADILDTIRDAVVVAYTEKSGLNRDEVVEIMKAESWLNADNAVEKGFADEIEEFEVSMKLEANCINMNGLKITLEDWNRNHKLNNNKNLNISGDKVDGERKTNMDLLVLCQQVGLNYEMLKQKGMSDDEIKAMALEIKLKQYENKPESEQAQQQPTVNQEGQPAVQNINDRKLSLEIVNLCDDFSLDKETRNRFLESNMSIDQVRTEVLNHLRTQNQPIPAGHSSDIRITQDEADRFRNCASDALIMRGGIQLQNPAEGSRELRVLSLRDLAIECLIREGVSNPHRLSSEEIFRMALTAESQFGSILDDSVNKSMRNAYEMAPATWRAWCGIDQNPDFKTKSYYRLSEAGDLVKISENSEIPFDQMSDEKATTKLETYARMFGYTRKSLINDDLGVITRTPQSYVLSAMRNVNTLVYKILGENPTIFDNVALFHTGTHKNLASSGSAINKTSVSAAETRMMKQTNIRGKETLNIQPKYMIVPADKKAEGATFLKSLADISGSNAGSVNIYHNAMELVVDAELSKYSTTAWYLAADPRMIDTIVVSFLNGQEMPMLESAVSLEYLGRKWRILHDVAATAVDYKGLQKDPGA